MVAGAMGATFRTVDARGEGTGRPGTEAGRGPRAGPCAAAGGAAPDRLRQMNDTGSSHDLGTPEDAAPCLPRCLCTAAGSSPGAPRHGRGLPSNEPGLRVGTLDLGKSLGGRTRALQRL